MNMPTGFTARIQPANTDSRTLCQYFVALATLSHVVVDNVRRFADLLEIQSNSRQESSFRKHFLEQWVCTQWSSNQNFPSQMCVHMIRLWNLPGWRSFTDMTCQNAELHGGTSPPANSLKEYLPKLILQLYDCLPGLGLLEGPLASVWVPEHV